MVIMGLMAVFIIGFIVWMLTSNDFGGGIRDSESATDYNRLIVGRWSNATGTEEYDFRADGRLYFSMPPNFNWEGAWLDGTWSLTGNELTIIYTQSRDALAGRLRSTSINAVHECTITIIGNELTMFRGSDDGRGRTYTRQR